MDSRPSVADWGSDVSVFAALWVSLSVSAGSWMAAYSTVVPLAHANQWPLPKIVKALLTSCSSLIYAIKILRNHGIPMVSLHDVFCITILANVTCCLPAWSGLCSASDCAKLDSFLNRCKHLGYYDNTVPMMSLLIMLMIHCFKLF